MSMSPSNNIQEALIYGVNEINATEFTVAKTNLEHAELMQLGLLHNSKYVHFMHLISRVNLEYLEHFSAHRKK